MVLEAYEGVLDEYLEETCNSPEYMLALKDHGAFSQRGAGHSFPVQIELHVPILGINGIDHSDDNELSV